MVPFLGHPVYANNIITVISIIKTVSCKYRYVLLPWLMARTLLVFICKYESIGSLAWHTPFFTARLKQ